MSTDLLEKNFQPAIDDLRDILSQQDQDEIEEKVNSFTLADAIREGSQTSDQAFEWGSGTKACAFSSAVISCKARGLA